MLICPIKVTFFFTVNSFYKYVQSNQSNVRDRKILSHHKQMLFHSLSVNVSVFFMGLLFLIFFGKSLQFSAFVLKIIFR